MAEIDEKEKMATVQEWVEEAKELAKLELADEKKNLQQEIK